jgi:hypothetical protein
MHVIFFIEKGTATVHKVVLVVVVEKGTHNSTALHNVFV